DVATGIIYKQQQKYPESLECFDRILRNPPAPLANLDIWLQIGHLYEQAKNYEQAKEAYERVLADSPNHAKVLQQLGWLYHQPGSSFNNQDMVIQCLTKSLKADSGDAQSWYLLGRAYMAFQNYQKAYEAYQQAVYRDGRNPTFWCSIGVLYYNINQYRDALDAYSRDPDQPLHPGSLVRLGLPSAATAAPRALEEQFEVEADPGSVDEGGRRSAEYGRHPADEPFHGGAPPPLNLHDSAARRTSGGHAPLAPMELDRRDEGRRYPPEGRDRSTNGPTPPPLFHHPVPQPPIHGISEMAPPPPGRDTLPSMNSRAPYVGHDGHGRGRRSPPDESPRASNRRPAMSPPPGTPYNHQAAPYSRSSSNFPPTPQGLPPPITSAHHGLPYDRNTATSTAANESLIRTTAAFLRLTSLVPIILNAATLALRRTLLPRLTRDLNTPRLKARRYDPRYDGEPPHREGWDRDRDVAASRHSEGPPPPLPQQPLHHHHHATSDRVDRSYNATPELGTKTNGSLPPSSMSKPPPLESATRGAWSRGPRGSESPPPGPGSSRATAEPPKERKKRGGKEKDDGGTPKPVKEKKERKQPTKRGAGMKQGLVEQESDSRGSVAPMAEPQQHARAPPFKAPSAHKPPSDALSQSGTTTPSVPQPPAHIHRPSRSVDEDYDEEGTEREDAHGGAAAALMGLAAGNGRPPLPPPVRSGSGRIDSLLNGPPTRSPSISTRGPIDRVRSPPPDRTGTPLKRGASSDETMDSGERKRSGIDSNESSSSANSPPVANKFNAGSFSN
ncbi:hypothetical protein FRB90_004459, partial [Tulasnella sp. 427]